MVVQPGRRARPGRVAAGALDRLDRPARAERVAGRADWSPKFTTTALRLDGEPTGRRDSTVINHEGPAVVEVDAVDEIAGLALTVTVD